MGDSLSKRRMAENEVFFRQYNERVQQGFEEVRQVAREENQEHLIEDFDIPLHFYCECSDENCRKRIMLRPSQYTAIHRKRDQFIIICGHETKSIEDVVSKKSDYCIVRKFDLPPQRVPALSPTPLNNT